ncbi:MAG: MFS transporter [Pseudorhodoplanes sp.]
MTHLLARFALLCGNFITGIVVLGPAGMLPQLAEGLEVSISRAGLLVTWGAVVLCFAAPIMSWLTTRLDRRLLATAVLVVAAVCSFASSIADSYAVVLALRLATMVLIAIYTPLAASTISLIVPEHARASAVAFIFLGWSLSIALGLPLVTLLANQFGWRETYVAIGAVAAAAAVLNFIALPGRLRGFPLSLESFAFIARNRRLVLILLLTLLSTSGIFQITIYMGPLLSKLAGAGAGTAGTFFLIIGIAGLFGNSAATAAVARIGAANTLACALLALTLGATFWAVGAGWLIPMGIGVLLVGAGLPSSNTMQQARLIAEKPDLANATVALNTSLIYVGQAIGSASGGFLYDREMYHASGYVSVGFFLLAFVLFLITERSRRKSARAS